MEGFIKITDSEHLLKVLRKNKWAIVVLHYYCSECDDEQVTDNNMEINDTMIHQLGGDGDLYVWYDCTNCGIKEKFINKENIYGVEFVEE